MHPSPAARRFVTVRLPRVALAKAGLLDKEAFRARWLEEFADTRMGLHDRNAVIGQFLRRTNTRAFQDHR